jgi:hypothetical protein
VPRSKKTITRDSVFRNAPAPAETPAPAPAIPQGIQDEVVTRQTAIWLSDEETEWLDDQIQKIKRSGWRGVTRSALLRAIIREAMQQGVDLAGVSGPAELSHRLSQK